MKTTRGKRCQCDEGVEGWTKRLEKPIQFFCFFCIISYFSPCGVLETTAGVFLGVLLFYFFILQYEIIGYGPLRDGPQDGTQNLPFSSPRCCHLWQRGEDLWGETEHLAGMSKKGGKDSSTVFNKYLFGLIFGEGVID